MAQHPHPHRQIARRRALDVPLARYAAGAVIVAATAFSATRCIHSGICGIKVTETANASQMLAPRTVLTFAPPVATVRFESTGHRLADSATF